jgi:Cu/Ag efflux pump CusA
MIGSSLKWRYIVLAITAAVLLLGIVRMRDTSVDVFPAFAPPSVENSARSWAAPPATASC